MEAEARLKALEVIESVQRNTSSVVVEVGGVKDNGQVDHESLYVRDSCIAIVNALQDEGFEVSADSDGGLRVHAHSL